MAKNKVKFNLSNVHFAPVVEGENGEISWEVPIAMPGAVSISLDADGEVESFYADGVSFYEINSSQGYSGDLELALIPEIFSTRILNETSDSNKVLVENSNAQVGRFALLFEFDGDQKHIRHVMYNCTASRPSIASKTNEETKEVQTETLTIKARPLMNGLVKAKTGDSTKAAVYNGWYKKVYQPDAVGGYEDEEEEEVSTTES